jgi:hypothetical protein
MILIYKPLLKKTITKDFSFPSVQHTQFLNFFYTLGKILMLLTFKVEHHHGLNEHYFF